jgi:hypothetical protein
LQRGVWAPGIERQKEARGGDGMSALEHQPLDLDACACEDCRFWRVVEPMLVQYRDTKERRESLFILKCLRLAKDFEAMEALMRGEKVPRSRLDPYWVEAYGMA